MPKPKKVLTTTPQFSGQVVMQQHADAIAQSQGVAPPPAAAAGPEAWANYVNVARGKAAAAIVEWGRRIALALSLIHI